MTCEGTRSTCDETRHDQDNCAVPAEKNSASSRSHYVFLAGAMSGVRTSVLVTALEVHVLECPGTVPGVCLHNPNPWAFYLLGC